MANGDTDLSVPWVDTWKVDFIDKLNRWWFIGVLVAAVHLKGVDPVLVNTLQMNAAVSLEFSWSSRNRRT